MLCAEMTQIACLSLRPALRLTWMATRGDPRGGDGGLPNDRKLGQAGPDQAGVDRTCVDSNPYCSGKAGVRGPHR